MVMVGNGIVDIKYPKLKKVMGVPVIGTYEQLQDLYNEGYHRFSTASAHAGIILEKATL